MDETIKATIEKQVGLTWADIKARFSIQAASIERTCGGDPVDLVMRKLEEDDEYRALLAKTDTEAGLAGLVNAVAPILKRVAGEVFHQPL
jgi:hypothetical protein